MTRSRLIATCLLLGSAAPSPAELVVSQLIVELGSSSRTADVLVFNRSDERTYISIEPREILHPGTPEEKGVTTPDPRALGLIVSSKRLILEPNQKRLLRLAATSIPQNKERVYRVVVKPVVAGVESESSGLKLLVGYEMLVMVRPAQSGPLLIEAKRTGNEIVLANRGGASVELFDGRACYGIKGQCSSLPSGRLYAGASLRQKVSPTQRVEYRAVSEGKAQLLKF